MTTNPALSHENVRVWCDQLRLRPGSADQARAVVAEHAAILNRLSPTAKSVYQALEHIKIASPSGLSEEKVARARKAIERGATTEFGKFLTANPALKDVTALLRLVVDNRLYTVDD
jgi:hypothetical protein